MTHLLDSVMIYIHPPLAILGYLFVIFSVFSFMYQRREKKYVFLTRAWLYFSWFFNLLGLLTGMIWAQLAWGSYWSWDPKETMTLLLFLTVSISVLQYEKREKITLVFLLLSLLCILINIVITIGSFGLHSYNL